MTTEDQFLTKGAKLVNIGLTLGSALGMLTFLNFFYRYSWTRERQFSRAIDVALYYVLPLGIALVLLASTKLKPGHRANILILGVSLTVSIYAAEFFLESRYTSLSVATKPVMIVLADSRDKKKDAARLTKKFGIEIDTRTSGEVLDDLRKKGVDAVPIVTPSNHLFVKQPDNSIKSAINIDGREVMPLAGVSSKVTILCNEGGPWIDFRSDAHGFNNASNNWHSGPIEIAALGDSFTQGYCVPADKNFVALIGQRHPVVNLGVAGDGPLLMLAKLNEYLPVFKPKTVLWFYYEGNDLTDLQIERKSALLRNYLEEGFTQPGLAAQSDIDRAIMDEISRSAVREQERAKKNRPNEIISTLVAYAKLSYLRQRLGLVGGVDAEDLKTGADLEGPNMDVFRNIMFQAKARVNASGGQLYFVYLPEWARYANYTSWGKTKRNDVLNIVGNLGLPVVDIDGAFQAHGDPLSLFPFRGVGHYTEDGHRLVAEEVLRSLSPELAGPKASARALRNGKLKN